MPQPKQPDQPFTPSQALYILEKAIADRKISKSDVREYMASMHREISHLETRLSHLRSAIAGPIKDAIHRVEETVAGRLKRRPGRPTRTTASAAKPSPPAKVSEIPPTKNQKRKKRVSPEVRASRQLQGQYIAAIRQVPEKERPRFVEIAKAKGREAAIAAIKKER